MTDQHVCTCHLCPVHGSGIDPYSVQGLRLECERLNFQVRYPDLVNEEAAAHLIGYNTADSLRKQATGEHKVNPVEFVMRGNRRFYPLQKISKFLKG